MGNNNDYSNDGKGKDKGIFKIICIGLNRII